MGIFNMAAELSFYLVRQKYTENTTSFHFYFICEMDMRMSVSQVKMFNVYQKETFFKRLQSFWSIIGM